MGSFGTQPGAAHCDGSVKPGWGFPLASTQGELKVEFDETELSCSRRKVCE